MCVLDRHHHTPFLRKLLRSAKRILRYCLGAEKKENILSIWMTAGQMRTISRHTSAFIDRHIPHTRPLLRTKELRQAAGNEHIDAYVVGSDQVWRPVFSPCITNYYIDFDQRDHIIRIAYAASFGVDTWEYDRQAQQVCAGYAKNSMPYPCARTPELHCAEIIWESRRNMSSTQQCCSGGNNMKNWQRIGTPLQAEGTC